MNKSFVLGGLMLALFAVPALAQQPATQTQNPTAQTGRMGRRGDYKAADPATRARRMTDRLTKELSLDQATAQKVYAAALERAQAIDGLQANATDRRAQAKQLKANADQFQAKLKTILTPDQFAKFESMRSEMRHGRGKNRPAHAGTDQR